MVRWRSGTVVSVDRRWRGSVQLSVLVAGGVTVRALAHPDLVGEPVVGDRVLLNVGALELGLGTGGYALVAALPDRLPVDAPGAGHLVKARYTPLQAIVLGADEEASPHRAALVDASSLDGMPVVTADLHSALTPILVGIHDARPDARVAYVMTDGGALPAWFSRTLSALGPALAGTVTAGQAFGGDLEAVNVHSGLLAARWALHADVTVVAQGPGNLGSGSRWGFSGVAVGEAVNAAATLGGRPVGSLRLSGVDPRPRHRGVSHHSLTAYGRVALVAADLVVPVGLPDAGPAHTGPAHMGPAPAGPAHTGPAHMGPAPAGPAHSGRAPVGLSGAELVAAVDAALAPLAGRHRLVRVPVDGLLEALRRAPAPLSTMGRGLDDDPAYFLAAAAAGRHAAALLGSPI